MRRLVVVVQVLEWTDRTDQWLKTHEDPWFEAPEPLSGERAG
jgi:hypothetical protein